MRPLGLPLNSMECGVFQGSPWALRTDWVVTRFDDSRDPPGFVDGTSGSISHRKRHCPTGCGPWTPICVCVAPEGLPGRRNDIATRVGTISRRRIGVPKRGPTALDL